MKAHRSNPWPCGENCRINSWESLWRRQPKKTPSFLYRYHLCVERFPGTRALLHNITRLPASLGPPEPRSSRPHCTELTGAKVWESLTTALLSQPAAACPHLGRKKTDKKSWRKLSKSERVNIQTALHTGPVGLAANHFGWCHVKIKKNNKKKWAERGLGRSLALFSSAHQSHYSAIERDDKDKESGWWEKGGLAIKCQSELEKKKMWEMKLCVCKVWSIRHRMSEERVEGC